MKYIALDIGQCCIRLDRPACFAYLGYGDLATFPPEMEPVFVQYEKGQIDRGQFLAGLREQCHRDWTDKQILNAFVLMLGTEMPGMAETIAEIKRAGTSVAFFSDASEYHREVFYSHFPAISSQVPEGVFSYEVGCYKPEPPMYEEFERRFGVPVLYTDDREQNIAAAQARGWPAWQFTDIDSFRSELSRRKLI